MIANTVRAIRARTMLIDHYDRMETDVIDLLTDLMHMCKEDGIDFVICLSLAEVHFQAEIDGEV